MTAPGFRCCFIERERERERECLYEVCFLRLPLETPNVYRTKQRRNGVNEVFFRLRVGEKLMIDRDALGYI